MTQVRAREGRFLRDKDDQVMLFVSRAKARSIRAKLLRSGKFAWVDVHPRYTRGEIGGYALMTLPTTNNTNWSTLRRDLNLN